MGWSGSLTQNSALGSKILFTPEASGEGEYEVASFTAPRKGVYRFELKGSGGTQGIADGGTGGATDGYLLLEKDETVFVGAGGTCSAAFVSYASGAKLSDIARASLLLVAGAGGAGGSCGNTYVDQIVMTGGGNGGGASGTDAEDGGRGASQSGGGVGYGNKADGTMPGNGAYGVGGDRGSDLKSSLGWAYGGRGGDGYFGGGGGAADASTNSLTGWNAMFGFGGGGGSGYVRDAVLQVHDKTYDSKTQLGGGAKSGERGSVQVTYYARAELPMRFDHAIVERLFFNGTEIGSLVFNGAKLFMRRWMRCLQYPGGRSACRAATRGSFLSAWTA